MQALSFIDFMNMHLNLAHGPYLVFSSLKIEYSLYKFIVRIK